MDSSDSNSPRTSSLTPEERRQIYEEERRRLETPAPAAAVITTSPFLTRVASRRRPILVGVAALALVALAWIGLSPRVDTPQESSGSEVVVPALRAVEEKPPAPSLKVDNVALTAMQEDNDVLTVTANLEADHELTTLRVEGVAYPLVNRSGKDYVFQSVKVPRLGENNAKLVIPAHGSEPFREAAFTITRELRTIDEWRKYAQPIDYKRLSKNADSQAGMAVQGRGRIYQITEGYGMTEGGLNVTPKGYGFWDDNLRFTMDSTTDFVEDDVVAFYGFVVGDFTYTSTAGWNITVPAVQIEMMERG